MTFQKLRQYRRVYVSSPYSLYKGGTDAACAEVARITGDLILEGIAAFSPIAHSHTVSQHSDIDAMSHDIWLDQDEAWLEVCEAMVIVEMYGWRESFGIAHEAEYFRSLGRPVFYLDPETMQLR